MKTIILHYVIPVTSRLTLNMYLKEIKNTKISLMRNPQLNIGWQAKIINIF